VRKRDELSDPTSCMNRAHEDEMTFVLLGRDVCAPAVIRIWAELRVSKGKNRRDDNQILEALAVANLIEYQQALLDSSPIVQDLAVEITKIFIPLDTVQGTLGSINFAEKCSEVEGLLNDAIKPGTQDASSGSRDSSPEAK
jgi:hypothetical protein